MRAAAVALLLLFEGATPAWAQTSGKPAPAVEITAGYAGFVDDATIDHTMFGGAARVHLSPRISVGPEVQYMIGPDEDRDWLITGNLTIDILSPGSSGRPRTTPYVVAGGGWFQNTSRVGTGLYTSGDPAFTAGGGVRIWLSRRIYVAPEFRIQWELHTRISGTMGLALSN